MRTVGLAILSRFRSSGCEKANPHLRHRPEYWCPPQTSAAFHSLIKGIPVGDIHQRSSAFEFGKRGYFPVLFLIRAESEERTLLDGWPCFHEAERDCHAAFGRSQ